MKTSDDRAVSAFNPASFVVMGMQVEECPLPYISDYDLAVLNRRCRLAEAKCNLHDLERMRNETALDLRVGLIPRDEVSRAQIRLDGLRAEIKLSRQKLRELEACQVREPGTMAPEYSDQ